MNILIGKAIQILIVVTTLVSAMDGKVVSGIYIRGCNALPTYPEHQEWCNSRCMSDGGGYPDICNRICCGCPKNTGFSATCRENTRFVRICSDVGRACGYVGGSLLPIGASILITPPIVCGAPVCAITTPGLSLVGSTICGGLAYNLLGVVEGFADLGESAGSGAGMLIEDMWDMCGRCVSYCRDSVQNQIPQQTAVTQPDTQPRAQPAPKPKLLRQRSAPVRGPHGPLSRANSTA